MIVCKTWTSQVWFEAVSALDFVIHGTHLGALPTAEPYAVLSLELREPPEVEVLAAPGQEDPLPNNDGAPLPGASCPIEAAPAAPASLAESQTPPDTSAETAAPETLQSDTAAQLPAERMATSTQPRLAVRALTSMSLLKLHTPKRNFLLVSGASQSSGVGAMHTIERAVEESEEEGMHTLIRTHTLGSGVK